MGANKQYKKLHDNSTTIGDGEAISVINGETLFVSISGNGMGVNINFMGSLDGVNYFLVEGSNLSDSSVMANSTTSLGEGWEIDVTGLAYMKFPITTITTGNCSVVGLLTN